MFVGGIVIFFEYNCNPNNQGENINFVEEEETENNI